MGGAVACLVLGFLLTTTGIWLFSPALALIVAGLTLFVSGGVEAVQIQKKR